MNALIWIKIKVYQEMGEAVVSILSKHTVKPSPRLNKEGEEPERIHLTPWDLKMISMDYIQKGIL